MPCLQKRHDFICLLTVMLRLTDIRLPLDHHPDDLKQAICDRLNLSGDAISGFTVYRRNYDARKKTAIMFSYTLDVSVADEQAVLARFPNHPHIRLAPDMTYRFVTRAPDVPFMRPLIIGCGPCGLFAALILAQSGFKPIVLERGKNVRERTQDTFGFWRERRLDPESNVQFGEGGAGTFSDGKLHTQIRDPKHYGRKVLSEFVKAGAPEEILYIGKPHIGTFRLVRIIEQMRKDIIALGVEFRFMSRVDDLLIENGQTKGVVLSNGETIFSDHIVLAPGHSARDTFDMLYRRGIQIEAKPFSIGFRIEHPQSLIDRCRLGPNAGNPLLGAADYKLVHHCKNGRSVYSFCMCPGGYVVNASSEEGRLAVNGMSYSGRDGKNANSAIIVAVTPDDFAGKDPLAGVRFQEMLEERAFAIGKGRIPQQLFGDYCSNRASVSYGAFESATKGACVLGNLRGLLPQALEESFIEGMHAFSRRIPAFDREDAILSGVESRTSSPVRLVRDPKLLVAAGGIYPCGEGAGYAGGIMSAAMDGLKVAEVIMRDMEEQRG